MSRAIPGGAHLAQAELERALYHVGEPNIRRDGLSSVDATPSYRIVAFDARVEAPECPDRSADVGECGDAGRGACMCVVFHLMVDCPQGKQGRDVCSPALSRPRVLVADDEPVVRRIAERLVEELGFEPLMAVDGLAAAQLFAMHETEIAAVLLDMNMPGLSGLEVLHEIRAMNSDVPVILSTGFSSREAEERFAGQGSTAFLRKPWSPTELMRVLQSLNLRHT